MSFASDEMVCWYVDNPLEKWIKLFSVEKSIIPLSGFNNQLTGLIIDSQVRVFDDKLLFELSDNKEILYKIFKGRFDFGNDMWISGPNAPLFYQKFKLF